MSRQHASDCKENGNSLTCCVSPWPSPDETVEELRALKESIEVQERLRHSIDAALAWHGQADDGLCAECGATWEGGCQSPTVKALKGEA